MVDQGKRKIVEFDGEQHRTDRAQYLKDIERLDRARQAGYEILRLHREDFLSTRIQATRRRLCEFLEISPIRRPVRLARLFAESA